MQLFMQIQETNLFIKLYKTIIKDKKRDKKHEKAPCR